MSTLIDGVPVVGVAVICQPIARAEGSDPVCVPVADELNDAQVMSVQLATDHEIVLPCKYHSYRIQPPAVGVKPVLVVEIVDPSLVKNKNVVSLEPVSRAKPI